MISVIKEKGRTPRIAIMDNMNIPMGANSARKKLIDLFRKLFLSPAKEQKKQPHRHTHTKASSKPAPKKTSSKPAPKKRSAKS